MNSQHEEDAMKRLFISLTISLALVFSAQVQAKIVTRPLEYRHDDAVLEGYLAYDDAIKGKRPGVLVVHEWWGLNDYAKRRAEQLAALGYVAFALDMYGKGVSTTDRKEAAKLAGQFRGKPLMRHRARAGLDVLIGNKRVDRKRIAAIGFCFGGTTVLELAYGGADLVGVVSFHGGLTMPKPEDMKNIKAKMLVLHGAEDPVAPPAKVVGFQGTMREAGVDWQIIIYGGAVHAFTNPAAGNDKTRGSAYDEKAARRSWQHMQMFFTEVF
jgi:dienelactone hydrolase